MGVQCLKKIRFFSVLVGLGPNYEPTIPVLTSRDAYLLGLKLELFNSLFPPSLFSLCTPKGSRIRSMEVSLLMEVVMDVMDNITMEVVAREKDDPLRTSQCANSAGKLDMSRKMLSKI